MSCPNPAMHGSRRDVFWPRLLEMVDATIPAEMEAGHETLLTRAEAVRTRMYEIDQAPRATNPGPSTGPN